MYSTFSVSEDLNPSKYQVMTKYNSQGFEGLLTITSLEPEDSGVYNCEAIQESPRIDDCMASVSVNISLQVNCRCSAMLFLIDYIIVCILRYYQIRDACHFGIKYLSY